MSQASSSSDPVDTVVIDILKEVPMNEDEVKARHLYDIRAHQYLNWLLDDWQKQFKEARDWRKTKTSATTNARSDLYQWIWFFVVFQGVVLTAVAQSTTLGCQQSWAPAAVSLVASLVIGVSVHFKLVNYKLLYASLLKTIYQSEDLHDQLAELRTKGNFFDFSCFKKRSQKHREFKGLSDFYYWAVISALVVCSGINLLVCTLVLCGPHRHKLGT